jgi:hypothetical protein
MAVVICLPFYSFDEQVFVYEHDSHDPNLP